MQASFAVIIANLRRTASQYLQPKRRIQCRDGIFRSDLELLNRQDCALTLPLREAIALLPPCVIAAQGLRWNQTGPVRVLLLRLHQQPVVLLPLMNRREGTVEALRGLAQ